MIDRCEHDNAHQFWQQGYFVDQPKYRSWTQAKKDKANRQEKLLVRPSPTGNAICYCTTPGDAKWIADRLNTAAKLEQQLAEFQCVDVVKIDENDIIYVYHGPDPETLQGGEKDEQDN